MMPPAQIIQSAHHDFRHLQSRIGHDRQDCDWPDFNHIRKQFGQTVRSGKSRHTTLNTKGFHPGRDQHLLAKDQSARLEETDGWRNVYENGFITVLVGTKRPLEEELPITTVL
jgi:hypothetical protein